MSWFFSKLAIAEILGVIVFGGFFSAILFGAITVVFQFSHIFPDGIFRYAATAFVISSMCVWVAMLLKPFLALFFLLIILPLGARLSEFYRIEIGEFVVTADVITIFIAFFIALRKGGFRRDIFQVCFAAFILVATISSIANWNSPAITIIFCGILTPFVVYLMSVMILNKMQYVKLLLNALGLIVVFSSIFAFIQPFINTNPAEFLSIRLVSVFYNPVIFAAVIVLLWPFVTIYSPFGLTRFSNITFFARVLGGLLSFSALILTGSRGAILTGVGQAVWMLFQTMQHASGKTRRALKFTIAGVLFIVILNLGILLESNLRRFSDIDFTESGNSASERILGALGGVELGLGNPLFGVGIGNFKNEYYKTRAASFGELELETAHNFLSNLVAEVGLFGVVLWLLLISISFRRIRNLKKFLFSENNGNIYIALKSSLFGFTVFQLLFFDEFMHKNVALPMILYFAVIGLISSLYFMQRERRIRV